MRWGNPAHGCSIGKIKRRTGIKLVACTTAGAHNIEAPAPSKIDLRVIWRSYWRLEAGVVIAPSSSHGGLGTTLLSLPFKRPHPTFVETTLPQMRQVGEGASLSRDALPM